MCQAIGQPELAADKRFTDAAARKANEDALEELITTWTSERDRWEVTGGAAEQPVWLPTRLRAIKIWQPIRTWKNAAISCKKNIPNSANAFTPASRGR